MSVALERYITVCFPFFKMRHQWPARNYIIPVIIISVLCNITRFFELEVVRFEETVEQLEENSTTDGLEQYKNQTIVVYHLNPTELRWMQ